VFSLLFSVVMASLPLAASSPTQVMSHHSVAWFHCLCFQSRLLSLRFLVTGLTVSPFCQSRIGFLQFCQRLVLSHSRFSVFCAAAYHCRITGWLSSHLLLLFCQFPMSCAFSHAHFDSGSVSTCSDASPSHESLIQAKALLAAFLLARPSPRS